MLEIRPHFELCDGDLASDTSQARISAYGRAFCSDRVGIGKHETFMDSVPAIPPEQR